MINFKSIPFLKIILPYVAGIFAATSIGISKNIHGLFLILVFVLIATFLFQYFYKPVLYLKKAFYIICVNVFLFILAFEACYLYQKKNDCNHYSHYLTSQEQSLIGVIDDLPIVTKKNTKLSVQLNCIENNNSWHYITGHIIVYLKNDSSKHLFIGNIIYVKSKLSYIEGPKTPNEFNYKKFSENKNIFHIVNAKPDQLQVIHNLYQSFSFNQLGATIKAKVVAIIKNSGMSHEAFSICSALLVGYDDEIDSDIINSFSHSGTLHILSVSGMHTGVLYGILLFVFGVFDKHNKYKKLKCFVIIISLLFFVFITGFSPSVLRAALMLTLIIIGKTFYKQGNAYNTLLLSAFILLLSNPYLVYDIGFLLSYFAVFGIMYLYPILNQLYVFENKIVHWLWSSVLLSVSATLFTLPISLYFFHQFPIWFAFSNVIIIPISMVLMVAAIILVCFYKVIFVQQFLVYLINSTTSIMLWLARLTDNPDYGFIDYIPFSRIDVVFCTLIIGLFLIIVFSKRYASVILFCVTIIAWLSVSICANYTESQERELLVFHVKQKTAFALRIGQTVYTHLNSITEKEFQRFVKPTLLTLSHIKLIPTTSDILVHSDVTVLNIAKPENNYSGTMPDYVIVSNNTPILTTNYKIKSLIIADCSNSPKFTAKLKKQCAQNNWNFYSVKEQGALQIHIGDEVKNRR